ncbi:MAG: hypothetical protein AAFP68_07130 [Pseudomonadota bacterium]
MDDTLMMETDPAEKILVETDVSRGDAVRARMQYLISQNGAILTQTQFADAKAGALMTILGLVAVKGSAPAITIIQNPLEMLAMAMIILSIGFCLVTLMPRFSGFKPDTEPPRHDRYTWLFVAMPRYSAELHGKFAREAEFGSLLNSVATSNVGASRVLARKFMMLRYGFITGFIGCGLLLIATNI